MVKRLRPFALLAAIALLVAFDLTVGPSAVFRQYCGPIYTDGGYVPSCRVELGTVAKEFREMLRARNRAIDPSERYKRPFRRPAASVA